MAVRETIVAAVNRAVETAIIDLEAPSEPRDERVQFDPVALQEVVRLSSGAGQDRAVVDEAIHEALRTWLMELRDGPRSLVVVRLEERLAAAVRPRSWRPTDEGGFTSG